MRNLTRTISFLPLFLLACGTKVDGQGCPEDPVTEACSSSLAEEGECLAEGGCWAEWGLSAGPSCNCPTTDAGKACATGADCEGLCLVPGSPSSKEGCTSKEGGSCSDFVTMFGCFCSVTDDGHLEGICAD